GGPRPAGRPAPGALRRTPRQGRLRRAAPAARPDGAERLSQRPARVARRRGRLSGRVPAAGAEGRLHSPAGGGERLAVPRGRPPGGRARLRARLRRRGLEAPAALFATVLGLNSASGRVPATLVDSTLRAAVTVAGGRGVAGLVSAEVAALVQGASMTLFFSKA